VSVVDGIGVPVLVSIISAEEPAKEAANSAAARVVSPAAQAGVARRNILGPGVAGLDLNLMILKPAGDEFSLNSLSRGVIVEYANN
jgi:hypothetical protein